MSQDKLFVIGIGGTGMRCLESFVHLCGMGMFDNQEIEILTLDTDELNGNKIKTEKLIDLYSRIKTSGIEKGGTPNSNTFFSAKLNLHRFWTDYSGQARTNYRSISKLAEGNPEKQKANKLISDLFLEQNTVQEFNLAHGYRAQTHLGSHLMYHAIVEAARNLASGNNVKAHEKELEQFLTKLDNAGKIGARVFVFGSIFGGTGASSIPVLPKAFQDFIKVRSGGASNINFSKIKFGSTLLTEYFTFKKPDAKQMGTKDDSVIADSSYFPLNSQAALQFYQGDPTVQQTYKSMYHIGWPIESKKIGQEGNEGSTITGGEKQKNPSHITELICACAAYDFFTKTTGLDVDKAEYLYRAIEFKDNVFNFSFNDFVGNENKAGETFANRLGAFFSLAHIILTKNSAAFSTDEKAGIRAFITQLEQAKLPLYSSISNEECVELNDYFKFFAYSFDSEKFNEGWFYQVRSTVAPGTFMFESSAFTSNPKELKSLDVGALFSDSKNHWPSGGFMSDRYDKFVKTLIEVSPEESQKVNTTKEKFLAHIYNAITKSQNFIN
jgi:hypothetical protein